MRLIYLSTVPAASYAQRPHFTVQTCLQRYVRDAVWVEPYPVRLPRPGDLDRPAGDHQGERVPSAVIVLDVPALPIEPILGGRWLNRRLMWSHLWRRLTAAADQGPFVLGIGRPSALAFAALRELHPAASFYEAMDEFPEFHRGLSRLSVRRLEDALAAQVDLVVASSTFLAEKFTRRGLAVAKVLNAYPMQDLPAWRPAAPGRLVLGFVGCLGSWIDWPLLVRLAEELPYAAIELIGPRMAPVPRRLPRNIQLLVACRQREVAGHLVRFSAGLIPFHRTPLTRGMDPIKFYEYRAFGLPVLSTTFGEMARRGHADGVFFLDRGERPATVVANALDHPTDPAAIARFRHDHDWQRRYADPDPFAPLFARPPLLRAA